MGNLSHPKFFSKRDDDGGGNFKKTLTINHLKQVGEEILFKQTKGKIKVKSRTEKKNSMTNRTKNNVALFQIKFRMNYNF